MALREDHLTDGEQVVLRLRTHPKVLLLAGVWALLLVAALVLLWWVLRDTDAYVLSMWVAGGVALVLAAWLVGLPVLRWRSERFTITNRRISHRHGILTRHGRDIPLHRINDIALEKGLLDRVLGCGTLIIESASDEPLEFDDIGRVEKVHSMLYREINDNPADDHRPENRVADGRA